MSNSESRKRAADTETAAGERQADGQPWSSIVEASLHTAEMMYGKQADAVLASDFLAQYTAKARAEAWDEGWDAKGEYVWEFGRYQAGVRPRPERSSNPYRIDGGAR